MALMVMLIIGRGKGRKHHDVQHIHVEAEAEERIEGDYCAEKDGAAGWEEAGWGVDAENEDAEADEY
ncbi:hypothetical protein MRX96_004304 [Rhipicephalus microplus]